MLKVRVNGVDHEVDVSPDTPLLWVVRDELGLTGTKYGCGMGMCGACTMHLSGRPVRTCVLPAVAVAGQEITTIEAMGDHPLKAAWIAEQVPQCGYCQSGQLMQAAGLLADIPRPTDEDIGSAMTNLCRCGTYDRIRKAIRRAAAQMPKPPSSESADPLEDGSEQPVGEP